MMRKDDEPQSVRVRCLTEVDALVGKYLTGETPHVHWVNTQTDFQFDTVEEAVEAVNDPFFRNFAHPESPTTAVLMEVREFRRYSAELAIAWELVELLTHSLEPIHLRRDGAKWEGAFGEREYVAAPTAALAICLAALRARRVEIEFFRAASDTQPAEGMPNAEIKSLYSRP